MVYGKVIDDLKIDGKPAHYGVLNERDARAGAGIMRLGLVKKPEELPACPGGVCGLKPK